MLRSAADADRLVLEVLRTHADSLLRVARRHSLCPDDAHDAYQRGLEIFLRHATTLEAEGAAKWLHTVTKHEAMRLRAQRTRHLGDRDVDFDGQESPRLPSADEQLASFDLLTRSAEALQRLKPQELRALWLRAQGHSYEEIAEINGWSYTKVNRCISEGRRAFLDRVADIGSGAECRRWEPVLSAMADGEASAKDLAAIRPHLRHCAGCRAQLGRLRDADRRVAALLPVGLVVDVPVDSGGLLARLHDVATHVHDRVVLSAGNVQSGVEAALPGKLAVVAASAAAAVGGGVAVERAVTAEPLPAKPARALAAAAAAPAAAGHMASREPTPASAPATAASGTGSGGVARRVVVRRTTRSEFGLSGSRGRTASTRERTAAREFAQPEPSGEPTAATVATAEPEPAPPPPAPVAAPAPAPPPPTSTRDTQTAAAEFGG